MTHSDLRARILTRIRGPIDAVQDDATFDADARAAFAWQFEHNAPYAAWCRRRGRTPQRTGHWTQIPPVPTAAFREVTLVAGRAEDAQAVFRTSGTTRGLERRGVHHVLDLSLYDASLLAAFDAWVLPDEARPAMLSLVPPPTMLPDSSLAHMIGVVIERRGGDGSGWFSSVDVGIDADALDARLRTLESDRRPACLLGTSFSFVHWLDALAARGTRYRLPPGSRLMDTGGTKGRSREVAEPDLRAAYRDALGVPAEFCINEYGMTELISQFYDDTLRETVRGHTPAQRRKSPPPWVRIRVVDPDTLEPVEPGRTGLLQIFDLANLYSVIAIQTEDVAVSVEDGFRLLGRAQGATPRGCSIAMDDLLAAARNTP